MRKETLDNVVYPMLVERTTTPETLKSLVKRVGEFSEEQTRKQKTTLKHLKEKKVWFVEDENFGLYLTRDQLKLWNKLI